MFRPRIQPIEHNGYNAVLTIVPSRRRVLVDDRSFVVLEQGGVPTRLLPPGLHTVRPNRDRVRVLPAGEQVYNVPGQEVMTSDSATVRATVSLIIEIVDPVKVSSSDNYVASLHLRVQLALRAVIGARALEQVLETRPELDAELAEAITPVAGELGLRVVEIAIRDLVVPGQLKAAVTEVLTARLAGQAALERARAETAALRSLANAARMAEQAPALLTLRTLQQIEATSGNTFVIDTQPRVPAE